MNIIKKQRIKLNLTQKELAEKIGVHQVYISDFETYKRIPNRNLIYKFSDLFNICPILIFRKYYCKDNNISHKQCSKCKEKNIILNDKIIKEVRIKQNLTEKQLARKCNIDQSYISKIETYRMIPSPDIIFIISEKLKICPIVLFEEYYCQKHSHLYIGNRCQHCKK